MAGDEIVVPEVVQIEEADERRVELHHAAAHRAGLAKVGREPDVAKPWIVETGKAPADRLSSDWSGEASSTTTTLHIADGLAATNSIAFATKAQLL